MDTWIFMIVIVSFLFIITYDPKKGSLEKYIIPQKEQMNGSKKAPCCNKVKYRANHPGQCESAYYQGLQFADQDYGCPKVQPIVYKGAIMSQ